jgi:L-threonylcarbamoyladenylate synthase
MRFLPVSDESIREAAALLSGGGLVAFPTETVYGLGGDAFNAAALARIFEAKNRPRFDPLIIHIAALETLERLADISILSSAAREKLAALSEQLWPGPLTLVLPKQDKVPDLATSGLPTVAIRFPDHPAARQLIALSTGAVAAPSANPFGCLSPSRAEHVRDQLGDKVDIILDGGPARVGVESTVLDLCGPVPAILRQGGTTREDIEKIIGPVQSGSTVVAVPSSPGQLKSHYAPSCPLFVYSREEMIELGGVTCGDSGKGEGLLFFDGSAREAWLEASVGTGRYGVNQSEASGAGASRYGANQPEASGARPLIRTLSESGNTLEAAANLFAMLHELDGAGLGAIRAQLAPDTGLGPAINDRLCRGSARE